MHAGEYAEAMALLRDAVSASSAAGEAYLEALGLCYLGRLMLAWGEHDEARGPLDRALALVRTARPQARVLPLLARAQLARAEGEPELARRLLGEAVDVARAGGEGGPRAPLALADLSADEGDRVAAQRLYEEALELARTGGAEDHAAQALEGLARLARVEGATRQAASFQRRALRLRHARGETPGLAGSLQAGARLGVATDRVVHAAQLVGAADALRDATDFGSPAGVVGAWTAGRSPSPPPRPAGSPDLAGIEGAARHADPAAVFIGRSRGEGHMDGWDSLTAREREVAELVADGLTNKAVAERLVITPATVKTHLEHIFAKLEISRRSELAREVWRRGGTGRSDKPGGADTPANGD